MKTFYKNQLSDLISWIESQKRFTEKQDLNRIKAALKLKQLDRIDAYAIHVAGTNGKGSVCAYLTQILINDKRKVGTFTSPYILTFNERIRINQIPIDDESLLALLIDIKAFNDIFKAAYGQPLSFFELLTIAALTYFKNQKVDVMVMEVGIGGLLDATNGYTHYDLSLITNIGFDHMAQLGYTLEEIASNKLGILRKNSHLITTVDPSLHPYFERYCHEVGATYKLIDPFYKVISLIPLIFIYELIQYRSGLAGLYQISNAILAIEAIKYMPFNIDGKTIQKGLLDTKSHARFEIIKDNVIIDGAHNIHAINALKNNIKHLYPNDKIHIIFSALKDKHIQSMLDSLLLVSNKIDLVSFPDARFVSLKAYENDVIKMIDDDTISYIEHVIEKREKNELIVITGSLHFVSFVLSSIQ